MTTQVEIVNIALGIIGANLITSLGDDSEEAKLATIHYNAALEATLELQPWSFAIKRFKPAQDAETPLFGWGFSYTVPSEIIRVLSCDNIGAIPANMVEPNFVSEFEQIDFIIEDRKILANVEVVYARGIKRDVSEGKFPPLFVHMLSAKLAMLMALPLTQSNQIFQTAASLYAAFGSEATSRDQIQGRSKRIRNRSLLRVR